MRTQSNESSPVLSKLHRNIRLQQWQEVCDTILQDSSQRSSPVEAIVYNAANSIIPLLLQENAIGWTAVHFAALHGASDLSCWTWILTRVLEDYHLFMRHIEEGDESGHYLDYRINPFFRRTQAGHSPTDLFFSKRLHPFPWEIIDARRNAERLKEGLNFFINLNADHEMLVDLRMKIRRKMDEEKKRQQEESFGFCYASILSGMTAENRGTQENGQAAIVEGDQELEHEMSVNDHVHEVEEENVLLIEREGTRSSSSRPYIEEFQVDNTILEELVNFWHEMELLLIAATRLELRIDDDAENDALLDDCSDERQSEWRVVHGLSIVGCPKKIANLAVKLYPEQVDQFDENGNLPLHLASSSHQTSALAEGTWHHDHTPYGENAFTAPPMMKCLLRVYPEAASVINAAGRYPINLAILAGKTWQDGVYDLFRAGPNVVLDGSIDRTIGLPPFMLAALPRYSSIDDSCLKVRESIFEQEMRAKRSASKNIGSMWMLLPDSSKVRALSEAKIDIHKVQLTSIYQLLRLVPEFIGGVG